MSFVFPSLSDMAVGFIALLTLAWTFSVGAASQNETAGAGKVVCVFNLLLLLVTETKTLQPCHSFFKSRSPLMPNYIYPLCVCVSVCPCRCMYRLRNNIWACVCSPKWGGIIRLWICEVLFRFFKHPLQCDMVRPENWPGVHRRREPYCTTWSFAVVPQHQHGTPGPLLMPRQVWKRCIAPVYYSVIHLKAFAARENTLSSILKKI